MKTEDQIMIEMKEKKDKKEVDMGEGLEEEEDMNQIIHKEEGDSMEKERDDPKLYIY